MSNPEPLSTAATAAPGEKQPASKVTWDEPTIAEHDKDRGTRQKISEPKTPYRPERIHGGAGAAQSPASAVSDESSVVSRSEEGLDESKLHAALSAGWGDNDFDYDAHMARGEAAWEDAVLDSSDTEGSRSAGAGVAGAATTIGSSGSGLQGAPSSLSAPMPRRANSAGDHISSAGGTGAASSGMRVSSSCNSTSAARRTPLLHTHSHAGMHPHFMALPPPAATGDAASAASSGVDAAAAASASADTMHMPADAALPPTFSSSPASSASVSSSTGNGFAAHAQPPPVFPFDEHDRESGAAERSGFESKRKSHYGGEFQAVRALRAAAAAMDEDEEA